MYDTERGKKRGGGERTVEIKRSRKVCSEPQGALKLILMLVGIALVVDQTTVSDQSLEDRGWRNTYSKRPLITFFLSFALGGQLPVSVGFEFHCLTSFGGQAGQTMNTSLKRRFDEHCLCFKYVSLNFHSTEDLDEDFPRELSQ